MPGAGLEEKINVNEASLDKNGELRFFFFFLSSLNTNDINYRTRYLNLWGEKPH